MGSHTWEEKNLLHFPEKKNKKTSCLRETSDLLAPGRKSLVTCFPPPPTCYLHSQESLTQRSSPLPQYCLPLVRRLALTGLSSLGLRMTLKICFPVHRVTGYRKKEATVLVGWAWSQLQSVGGPPATSSPSAHTNLQYCWGREVNFNFFILANQYWSNDLASLGAVKEGVFKGEEIGT